MENVFEFINILYVATILVILVLLIFAIISFIKPQDVLFQVWYIIAATFCCGFLSSVILINYSSKSAIIWPILIMTHVLGKALELRKQLRR
jgi:hypothetical protein